MQVYMLAIVLWAPVLQAVIVQTTLLRDPKTDKKVVIYAEVHRGLENHRAKERAQIHYLSTLKIPKTVLVLYEGVPECDDFLPELNQLRSYISQELRDTLFYTLFLDMGNYFSQAVNIDNRRFLAKLALGSTLFNLLDVYARGRFKPEPASKAGFINELKKNTLTLKSIFDSVQSTIDQLKHALVAVQDAHAQELMQREIKKLQQEFNDLFDQVKKDFDKTTAELLVQPLPDVIISLSKNLAKISRELLKLPVAPEVIQGAEALVKNKATKKEIIKCYALTAEQVQQLEKTTQLMSNFEKYKMQWQVLQDLLTKFRFWAMLDLNALVHIYTTEKPVIVLFTGLLHAMHIKEMLLELGYYLDYESCLILLSDGKQVMPVELIALMVKEITQARQEKAHTMLARSSLSLDDIASINVVKLQAAQLKPIDNRDFDLMLNSVKHKGGFLQSIWRTVTSVIDSIKHLFNAS